MERDYNLEMENRIKQNALLDKRVESDEGLGLAMYKDSLGNWTIGWGHNLNYPISVKAAQVILKDDIRIARSDVSENFMWAITYIPLRVFNVLVELCFWMGIEGLLSFHEMIAALKKKDYKRAAAELLDSSLGRKYPNRTNKLADIIAAGGK